MGDHVRTIVIVLHDLGLGGTERIAIRLANRWAASGRHVTLFCGSRRGPLVGLIDKTVEVVECDPQIPRGDGSRRRLGMALAAFVKRRRPDVLFIPGNFHWLVLPAIDRLPATLRPTVVVQISAPLFRHGRGFIKQLAFNLLTRWRLRQVDSAVSLSPAMTVDADAVLGRQITQCVRLPALNDDEEAEPRSAASGKVILAAGRLVREKGFELALRAFAMLDDETTRLVILGEGPRRASLAALAASLGVADRVEFPGCVPDIRPWLNSARVFLLTSYYEGYAAVVVEALDAGRPVVSTACTPAAVELLRSASAGAVAPIGDAASVAACLKETMSAPSPDPERLASLVAGYRIGPISEAYLAIFDDLSAKRLVPGPRAAAVGVPAMVSARHRTPIPVMSKH